MKKSLLLATILFCCSFAFAQNELVVHNSDKGLYLLHTVAPKENYYSIGRLYNVSPKEIEAMNALDMNKGLNIGQSIKIPLTSTNYTQVSEKGRGLYYVVGDKEGLYRVSLKNNKVLMANLRKWNHLATDNITTGQKLIVGYLLSPEANNIVQSNPVQSEPVKKEVVPTNKDVVVHEPVEQKKPVEEVKTKEPEKKTEPAVTKSQPAPMAVNDGNGGYFRPLFEKQVKAQPLSADETATAGIFKTASGWQDAKYYALMDRVEPGTIVRIVNPSNNKAVYAKVLGEMSGIRQNQGYNLRLSNAAASALDINDTEKFIVRVNY